MFAYGSGPFHFVGKTRKETDVASPDPARYEEATLVSLLGVKLEGINGIFPYVVCMT